MQSEYMAHNASAFLQALGQIQANLANFSQDLDAKSEKVATMLSSFAERGQTLARELTANGTEQNGVDIALRDSMEAQNKAVQEWRDRLEEERKGREFMHKHEKYFVVMIFGAVKSGKSTLGNFFGGREFRRAAFDNAYKHIPLPDFQTEENARESGGIVRDEAGEKWFAEGVTDTTGSIQYFTLSGLRWVDSPGTGALGKDGDKRSMDKMVDEYIPYADMCIFLIHSGQPGLQEDMRYMEKLSREGQEAVIVITRSDTVEEDVDDAGNLIRIRVPKKPADRQKQEDDMRQRALAAYHVKEEHCRALSVSTLLAKQGIENGDEKLYRDSQLDRLMQILSDKAAGDAAGLKEKRPRRAFNAFIDKILGLSGAEDECASIASFQDHLTKLSEAITESQKAIDNESKLLVMDIKNATRREFLREAHEWEKSIQPVHENGKSRGLFGHIGSFFGKEYSEQSSGGGGAAQMDAAEITRRITRIMYRVMQKKINEAMAKLIGGYQTQEINAFQLDLKSAALHRKTTTVTCTYTVTNYRSREPRGFFEHVGSFFGKEYRESYESTRTEEKVIDLGTNIEELIDELLPQIEQEAQSIVQTEMQHLRDSYFQPQANYVQTMRKALKQLQEELLKLKYSD